MAEQDKGAATVAEPDTGTATQDGDQKTETTIDDKAIQAEVDRRVTQAVKTTTDKVRAEVQAEYDAKVEAERQEAERKRLEEKGEWQEVAQKTQAELDALRAEKARAEFTSEARATLKDKNLTAFEDVVLQPLDSIDGVTAAADALSKLVDERVEAELANRLHTADRPTKGGGGNGTPGGDPSEWSLQQKTQYIAEHGRAKWEDLLRDP